MCGRLPQAEHPREVEAVSDAPDTSEPTAPHMTEILICAGIGTRYPSTGSAVLASRTRTNENLATPLSRASAGLPVHSAGHLVMTRLCRLDQYMTQLLRVDLRRPREVVKVLIRDLHGLPQQATRRPTEAALTWPARIAATRPQHAQQPPAARHQHRRGRTQNRLFNADDLNALRMTTQSDVQRLEDQAGERDL